jgi:hypothetical protein
MSDEAFRETMKQALRTPDKFSADADHTPVGAPNIRQETTTTPSFKKPRQAGGGRARARPTATVSLSLHAPEFSRSSQGTSRSPVAIRRQERPCVVARHRKAVRHIRKRAAAEHRGDCSSRARLTGSITTRKGPSKHLELPLRELHLRAAFNQKYRQHPDTVAETLAWRAGAAHTRRRYAPTWCRTTCCSSLPDRHGAAPFGAGSRL